MCIKLILVCILIDLIYFKIHTMKTAGIVLIVLGFGLTIFTGFKFFTKEKVVDIGKLEISREKPHYLAWSPVVGIILIGVGGVVLWKNSKS